MAVFDIKDYRPYLWSPSTDVFATIEMDCQDEDGLPLRFVCQFHHDVSNAGPNFDIDYDGENLYRAKFPAAAYSHLLDLLRNDPGPIRVRWSPFKDSGARVVIGRVMESDEGDQQLIGFSAPES